MTVPVSVSIEEQIRTIIRFTNEQGKISFNRLLETAATRVEIIVTFLAVLELIKRRFIHARQEELFGDILLVRRENDNQPELEDSGLDYSTE